jgi:predicted PurR-regulated permease PerM
LEPTAPFALRSDRLSLAEYTRRVLVAVGIVVLALALWKLAALAVIAFAGVLAAVLVRALAEPLAERTGLGSRVAVTLVVLALAALVALAFWLTGETVVAQVTQLWAALPSALAGMQRWAEQWPAGRALIESLGSLNGLESATRVAGFAITTVGAIANLIVIFFLGVYLAVDPGLYRRGVLHLVPPVARQRVAHALDSAGEGLRKWLLGQLLAMIAVGLVTGLATWAIGVPFALSLGLIAGLLEFVPFVGPVVAAIPGILLAFSASPETALYATLAYLAIQQIEGNVLMPVVQRWAVSLPPALGVLAVVVFGLLLGLPGVLLAVPLMVVAMILVEKLYIEAALGESAAPEHVAASGGGPERRVRRVTDPRVPGVGEIACCSANARRRESRRPGEGSMPCKSGHEAH